MAWSLTPPPPLSPLELSGHIFSKKNFLKLSRKSFALETEIFTRFFQGTFLTPLPPSETPTAETLSFHLDNQKGWFL